MAQWIVIQSLDLAVCDHLLEGENMNFVFRVLLRISFWNSFESSNEEKWVGNKRKRFYSEI